MMRPDKHHYYLDLALDVAKRSTCIRRKYGAVIVKDDRIISTGYNGAPRGRKNCCDCGMCLREELKVPQGQRYELCRSVHAEANAIIHATYSDMVGSTLYLYGCDAVSDAPLPTSHPCSMCKRMIINAQIKHVVSYNGALGQVEVTDVSDWINEDDDKADDTPIKVDPIEARFTGKNEAVIDQILLSIHQQALSPDPVDRSYDEVLTLKRRSDDLANLIYRILSYNGVKEEAEKWCDIITGRFNYPREKLIGQLKHCVDSRVLFDAVVKVITHCYQENFPAWDEFGPSVKMETLDIISEGLARFPLNEMTDEKFHEFTELFSNKTAPKHELDHHHLMSYYATMSHSTKDDVDEVYIDLTLNINGYKDIPDRHKEIRIDKTFVRWMYPVITLYRTILGWDPACEILRDDRPIIYELFEVQSEASKQ